MWLLETSNVKLEQFTGANVPEYAILSHTWGRLEAEVSFRDMRKHRDAMENKAGYDKVKNCCLKALQDGHQYVWIDSCCIDKRSSAELSEALNSMYTWYENSQVCYVYLADVPSPGFDPSSGVNEDLFSKSRWFTRGWTLQELIAPKKVQFFAKDWTLIGNKGPKAEYSQTSSGNGPSVDILLKLAKITGIDNEVLKNPSAIHHVSIAQRMSWAAHRQTTQEEDIAYALMGLFHVNIPIMYGEGQKRAFKRLQSEIIKSSPDQTIFAWRGNRDSSGLLAESPSDFAESNAIQPWNRWATTLRPYSMTNMGLSVNLALSTLANRPGESEPDSVLAALRCWVQIEGITHRIQIYLRHVKRISPGGSVQQIYRRERCDKFELATGPNYDFGSRQDIYVLEDEQFDHIMLADRFARI